MFNVSDIVFHKLYGFGKILEITNSINGSYKISFKDGVKIINRGTKEKPFLTSLDSAFAYNIIDKRFESRYKNTTIAKGYDYYKDGNVDGYEVNDNEIVGKVSGSYSYRTVLRYSNRNIKCVCSCPVGDNCKHAIALMYKIKEDLDADLNAVKENIPKEVDETLLQYTNDVINASDDEYIEFIRRIMETLEDVPPVGIVSYITYLLSMENQEVSKDILYFIILTDKIKNIYSRFSSSISPDYLHLYRQMEQYVSLNKNIGYQKSPYKDPKLSVISYIARDDYTNAFNSFLDSKIAKPERFYRSVLLYVLSHNISENLLAHCISKIPNWASADKEIMQAFTSRISFVSLSVMSETKAFTNKSTIDEVIEAKDSSVFDKIARLGSIDGSIDYFLTHFDELEKIDKAKARNIASSIFNNTEYKKYIEDAILGMMNSNLLYRFMQNRYARDYSAYSYYYSFNIVKGDQSKRLIPAHVQEFEKHFIPYFNIEVDENMRIRYVFTVSLKYVPSIVVTKFFEFDDTKEIIWQKNCLVLSSESDLILQIRNYFLDNYKDRIDEEKKKVKSELKTIQRERHKVELENFIKEFSDDYKSIEAPSLIEEDKVRFEVSFENKSYNDGYISMTMKVGQSKMYIVKDIKKMVGNFKRGEFVSYGKQLSFYHTLKNLKSPYDKLMDHFMKYSPFKYLDYQNERNTEYISKDELYNILEILDGQKITYDSKTMVVDFSKLVDYKLSIDKDYFMRIEIDGSSDEDRFDFLRTSSALILFDRKPVDSVYTRINRIEASRKKMKLINFFNSYRDYSIEDNIQSFKDEIYSRYMDEIELDGSIRGEFKLSDIQIAAYFDYEDNKTITCRYELFRDTDKISAEELSSFESHKFKAFMRILDGFGFNEDNVIEDDSHIYNFLTADFSDLRLIADVYLSSSLTNKQIIQMPRQEIDIRYQNNMMSVFLEKSIFTNAELEKILSAMKHRKKFVLLKKDMIVDLTGENASDFYDAVNEFRLDKKDLFSEKRLPIYQSLKASAKLNNVHMDDYLKKMIGDISDFKNYSIQDYKVDATLRDFQKDGVKWMKVLSSYGLGGILADDMGLGKTLQTITLIKLSDSKKPSLIVCPKSLIFNWKNEYLKFDKDTKVVPIFGSSDYRHDIISKIREDEKTVYVSSYDSVRQDIDSYKASFDYIILDEAQVIKNVNALKSLSVKKLKGDHKFALTGTPIENNIVDLWSIFDFLLPEYFEELSTFQSLFQNEEGFKETIARRISPFLLRRTKEDVLKDLPPKFERVLSIEMGSDQRKIYDSQVLLAKKMLDDGARGIEMVKYLLRLRQACVDPSLFVDNYNGKSSKIDLLMDTVKEYTASGRKILIFSQFVQALKIVEYRLKQDGIKYFVLTGDTKAEDRIALANSFNKDSDIKVFLISLKAGGNGLNLIGADTVIHLDPWWNTSAENQATDRAHRIGQKKNVEVIKLICENSIEERVIELQNLKKDLIDKVISNDDSSVTGLSLDDLKFILSNNH